MSNRSAARISAGSVRRSRVSIASVQHWAALSFGDPAQASIEIGVCTQGVYVFYLELVTDLLHLFVYVIFFVIMFTNYGLPLHLVRPTAEVSRQLRTYTLRVVVTAYRW